ncbi:DUF6538 domain-containing protein [Shewanella algae]|uniref:DUF6538 domain-containing protein n=1 Tax=Shewanella algae TaxID=38313 RepID=UPI003CFCB6CA
MSSARTSSSPYLFQSRHGIWYARVVVPEDRRDAIGKRELRKTLATKDKREAVLRSWDVLKALHALAKGKASATQSPSASLESSQGRAVVSAPVPPEIPPVSPPVT